ncbi:MAG TPA: GNAT family N-acetyltransferase [Arthrobacter sp.]|jgi:ribosomal protein S18 acetylase RimI-like enzyme
MRLTEQMDVNGFAEFAFRDAQADGPAAVVDVRPASLRDVAAILSIEQQSRRSQPSPAALDAAMKDPDRHVVVASVEGEIVGWAKTHFWDYDDRPAPLGHYLGGVTVLPGWRRRGVGAALTAARLPWIWARAADAWYVVNARNLASIELHRPWNFTEVARGPKFHTTTFTGGVGLLMRAAASVSGGGCGSPTGPVQQTADG